MRTAVIAAAGLLLALTVLMSARVEARSAAKVASTGQKVAHGKTRKPVKPVRAKRPVTKPDAPEMLLAEPRPLEAGESGLHGVASFYGHGFQGRKVASGERFDVQKMTAASNHFALGTWLAVRRLDNDLCVIVRVNDRMRAHRTRIIDLSRGAAERLNMISAGLVLVRAKPLAGPPTEKSEAVCASAFSREAVDRPDASTEKAEEPFSLPQPLDPAPGHFGCAQDHEHAGETLLADGSDMRPAE